MSGLTELLSLDTLNKGRTNEQFCAAMNRIVQAYADPQRDSDGRAEVVIKVVLSHDDDSGFSVVTQVSEKLPPFVKRKGQVAIERDARGNLVLHAFKDLEQQPLDLDGFETVVRIDRAKEE